MKPNSQLPEIDTTGIFITSIFDRKSKTYGPAMSSSNEIEAGRGLTMFLSKPSILTQFPSDYELVLLGVFDAISGRPRENYLTECPRSLGLVLDFIPAGGSNAA